MHSTLLIIKKKLVKIRSNISQIIICWSIWYEILFEETVLCTYVYFKSICVEMYICIHESICAEMYVCVCTSICQSPYVPECIFISLSLDVDVNWTKMYLFLVEAEMYSSLGGVEMYSTPLYTSPRLVRNEMLPKFSNEHD